MTIPRAPLAIAITFAATLAVRALTSDQDTSPLTASVPVPPALVSVDGGYDLLYELHLINGSAQVLRLDELELVDVSTDRSLLTIGPSELDARMARADGVADRTAATSRRLEPAAHRVVYVELARASRELRQLRHRIRYVGEPDLDAEIRVADAGVVVVDETTPLVLGAPLRGGPWAAVYSPDWPRGHRRVFYTVAGQARIPGRFAIDWIKLDERGRSTDGRSDLVAAAYGYGADVLAVVDAVVAGVRDDMSEPALVSQGIKHPPHDGSGNYVSLEVGEGRYVFYEHLKPKSVRVVTGQRVTRGQMIAALGFTGDSTGPHLHLHVANANSPLGAEGVSFVLERFTVLGRYSDIADLGRTPWVPHAGPSARQRERPASNTVLRF